MNAGKVSQLQYQPMNFSAHLKCNVLELIDSINSFPKFVALS